MSQTKTGVVISAQSRQEVIVDDLVHALQLRERELAREQLEANRLVADLAAQALERHLQDAPVVEGEGRQIADPKPGCVGRVGRRFFGTTVAFRTSSTNRSRAISRLRAWDRVSSH